MTFLQPLNLNSTGCTTLAVTAVENKQKQNSLFPARSSNVKGAFSETPLFDCIEADGTTAGGEAKKDHSLSALP